MHLECLGVWGPEVIELLRIKVFGGIEGFRMFRLLGVEGLGVLRCSE